MNNIFLFRCSDKMFVEERVFITAEMTWTKLVGLVTARLNLSRGISHFILGDQYIQSIDEFVACCEKYESFNADAFEVYLTVADSNAGRYASNDQQSNPQSPPVKKESESSVELEENTFASPTESFHEAQTNNPAFVSSPLEKQGVGYNNFPAAEGPAPVHTPTGSALNKKAAATINLSSNSKMTPKTYYGSLVRAKHPLTHEVVSLSVPNKGDWFDIVQAMAEQLAGFEDRNSAWEGLLKDMKWSLVLYDEDGDAISPIIETPKKFWKYQALQASDESLAFDFKFPSESLMVVESSQKRLDWAEGETNDSLATDKESSVSSQSDNADVEDGIQEPPSHLNATRNQAKIDSAKSFNLSALSTPQYVKEANDLKTQDKVAVTPVTVKDPSDIIQLCLAGELSPVKDIIADKNSTQQHELLFSTKCPENENSPLHCACLSGNEKMMTWLLDRYVSLNALDIIYMPNSTGHSPLHLICEGGHLSVLRHLRIIVGPSAPVHFSSVKTNDDTSLLHSCVLHCQYDILTWLFDDNSRAENADYALEEAMEVNMVNYKGACPLHLACARNDMRMARLLVDRGAFVCVQDMDGNTPLMVACFQDDLVMAQWLYTNGATCSRTNDEGFSALHVASYNGNVSLARWLVMKGLGHYSHTSNSGVSVIEVAKLRGHHHLKTLFEDMRNVECDQFEGNAAFCDAVRSGNVKSLADIAESGRIDVDVELPGGEHALHIACRNGHFELAKALVTRFGADADAVDKFTGMTPLHVACLLDNIHIAQWLVQQCGANTMAQCFEGNSMLHYACQSGSLGLVEWIATLDESSIINMCNVDGLTPLYIACEQGFLEIAMLLVKLGGEPFVRNAFGRSLLHAAAKSGHLEVSKWLLSEFSESTISSDQDFRGCTAFYLACAHGFVDVAMAIHAANANVLETCAFAAEDGNSALHAACQRGHLMVVQWLMEVHPFESLNSSGKTPLEVAELANESGVVEWLSLSRQDRGDDSALFGVAPLPEPTSENDPLEKEEEVEIQSPKPLRGFSSLFSCVPVGMTPKPSPSTTPKPPRSATPPATPEQLSPCQQERLEELRGILQVGSASLLQSFLGTLSEADLKQLLNHVDPATGSSPFHLVCSGPRKLLETVLRTAPRGAISVNEPERRLGNSPLHCVCCRPELSGDLVLLLLGLGGDVSLKNKAGDSPLHALCRHPEHEQAVRTMRSIIELPRSVLQHLDLAVKSEEGLSLMHVAVEAGNSQLVRLLGQYCQSIINSRSSNHLTPLHVAVINCHMPIVEILLGEFQAFVNARDDTGMTAVLYACRHGHLRVAKFLAKQGANLFVEEDADGNALHLACRSGDFAMVKWLVRQGLRPDTENNDGVTPAQLVQKILHEEVVPLPGSEGKGEVEEYQRIGNWLTAWTLSENLGISVDEVLAEMSQNELPQK